ncbi:LysR family transcriptional regulator [Nannocystis radixulma]|uniref:LysR family transcriptional regulator n=1 Tax=Nannocystis radixulma TaxID=2995305 RepID=A0ABT5BN24_9BACT|nr:LysR family transcriptional regulator [Nannocystis radixulma]MDC0674783.1 LysR family transcriptional regulator [Nannocystis radixulma]
MPNQPSHFPRKGADALASSFAASYAGVVAFIAVVTEGSFARAGDRLGIGRSAVSRSIQKLEEQLDARLFFRTTRSTALTREGELFYENCHPGVERIVQALEDMRELRDGPPQGRLRVASTVGFGRKVVAPLLPGFQARYPEVAIDLLLDDAATEFTAGHVDVAFRDGRLEDSQIVAKQLFLMQMLVCAAPGYRSAHGLPRSVEELADHRCINLRQPSGRICEWEFKVGGRPRKFSPPPAMNSFNDVELVLQAVLDGQGLAQLPGYQIFDLLQGGALVPCLAQYAPDDRGHYICYLSRRHLPSRVRVFVDYMTAHTRTLNVQSLTTFSAAPR